MIEALSPLDGRYFSKTEPLRDFFSEEALIRYRVIVEIKYFIFLNEIGILSLSNDAAHRMEALVDNLSQEDALRIKEIEKTTNHDVKAVEYFIKEQLGNSINNREREHIHFALTSQDINNTAMPLMLQGAIHSIILPALEGLISQIQEASQEFINVPMLARTHGQAASPTTMGKELRVFEDRLSKQLAKLKSHQYEAKFGGATGNFNAHRVAYPVVNWPVEIDRFIKSLGLTRQTHTTQIDQYDNFAEVFQILIRINTILIDYSRDIWTYVSMDYFKQKTIANEVGSSAMPHKVNPIEFENAEGNLGLSICILEFLSRKLPISRLQRDLTDSTVTRNIGVPLGHLLIAIKSLNKGITKLEINQTKLDFDLTEAWAVVSEGIQTVLRREGWEKPYELLKTFSRGKEKLGKEDFKEFIDSLDAPQSLRDELLKITPHNYLGYSTNT